jgi:hypothetical protein
VYGLDVCNSAEIFAGTMKLSISFQEKIKLILIGNVSEILSHWETKTA